MLVSGRVYHWSKYCFHACNLRLVMGSSTKPSHLPSLFVWRRLCWLLPLYRKWSSDFMSWDWFLHVLYCQTSTAENPTRLCSAMLVWLVVPLTMEHGGTWTYSKWRCLSYISWKCSNRNGSQLHGSTNSKRGSNSCWNGAPIFNQSHKN